MATLTAVDHLGGRDVEQPGLVSQTLAFMVDASTFFGLTIGIEAGFGPLGPWLGTPVLFLIPYCWKRWHRSPGMALWGLFVYRTADPDRPIGVWLGLLRFALLLLVFWLACLFLLVSLAYAVDIALLRGVHPVDSSLGLRVVRFKVAPPAVDLVGHAFDTAAVFADVRLTELDPDVQPRDTHGNPD
jgi:hypothetical protein